MNEIKKGDYVLTNYSLESMEVVEIIENLTGVEPTDAMVKLSNGGLYPIDDVRIPTNDELANELNSVVEKWFARTFNCQSIENYKDLIPLEEYIEPIDGTEIEESIEAKEERKETLEERISNMEESGIESLKVINLIDKYNDEIKSLEEEIEDLQNELDTLQDDNYPIWNTLFEIAEPWDQIKINAQELGLGLINDSDRFNDTLFATSCGHSFYSAYWIPLYMSLFGETIASKFKDVDYSGM